MVYLLLCMFLSLLRARGGISDFRDLMGNQQPSSPRTRRYFREACNEVMGGVLFSAHAEVFPGHDQYECSGHALLRARGGISNKPRHYNEIPHSSPRTRRYFRGSHGATGAAMLFSAHAEVFPIRSCVVFVCCTLLRARGGISICPPYMKYELDSSPRTRRYFLTTQGPDFQALLFSAHAEVFPKTSACQSSCTSLLRARGGISAYDPGLVPDRISSPRTRRYFQVYLMASIKKYALLRARGGISSSKMVK